MNENEVARQTFGNSCVVSGPIFFLDEKLDQRPDILKNLVTANAACFYEFRITRNRGRQNKSDVKELPKRMSKKEESEIYFGEDSIGSLDESNSDDDEEYSPEPRVLRSSSEPVGQKYKLECAERVRNQDSDTSTSSGGSKSKEYKKELMWKKLELQQKRK
jgi:hypothetical protein